MSEENQPPVTLYGGTFDPVHFGHLRTALEVRELLNIDDFRLLPAGTPPHRRNEVTGSMHRLAMLKLAVAGVDGFSIDEREIDRPGPSYMVDTLDELRAGRETAPLVLVVGQDSANSLDQWHRWQDIPRLAHLLIMSRPGDEECYSAELDRELAGRRVETPQQLLALPAGRVMRAEVSRLSISSSGIRKMLCRGRSPRFLLPDAVLEYVRQHGLYS